MTYREESPAEGARADTWIRRVNAVGLVLGYSFRFGDQPAPSELEQLADLVPALHAKLADDAWKSKHATLVAKAEQKRAFWGKQWHGVSVIAKVISLKYHEPV